MCMKYINSIVECYLSTSYNSQEQPIAFYYPFNTITASKEENGSFSIGDFSIKTGICVLGTDNPLHFNENPIAQGARLHFTIRLTKCAKDPKNRLGIDLDEFDIDLAKVKDDELYSQACYPFLNYNRITKIEKIALPPNGFGGYVLKVLVRDNLSHKEDSIQTMLEFNVNSPEAK